MICKKAMKFAMGVGMVLCAGASFAAKTESFEGDSLDGATWFGDITDAVVSGIPTEPAVGFPIATNHMQVLNVEGSVICSNTTSSAQSSISDFLVFIPEPSDELGTDELDGAKVAIAAGTTETDGQVPLCLYCTTNGNNKGWGEIATVSTGAWVRVTLAFENDRCRVSLNGEPVKNDTFGFAASSGDATGGPWYKLAGSGNAVQSLSFIGCAKVDDVVIKDSFADDAFPATAVASLEGKNETVSYNNLNKWGMTIADVLADWNEVLNETSGMTVGQKIACGYDPNSDTKFVPVSITKTAADKATIKFPIESTAELARYRVKVEGGTIGENGTITNFGEAESTGDGYATIAISDLRYAADSNVIKFILTAQKPTTEEAVTGGTGE